MIRKQCVGLTNNQGLPVFACLLFSQPILITDLVFRAVGDVYSMRFIFTCDFIFLSVECQLNWCTLITNELFLLAQTLLLLSLVAVVVSFSMFFKTFQLVS